MPNLLHLFEKKKRNGPVAIIRHYSIATFTSFAMTTSIFKACQEQFPDGNTTEILQCVSDAFEIEETAKAQQLQNFLFVLSGAMIFFMQAGFAVLCAGAVRIKNVQNSMLKNLLDACGAALAFFLVGKFVVGGTLEHG